VVTGVAGVRIWVDRLSDRAKSPATIRCDQISAQEPAEACKARISRCVSSRLCKKLDGRLAMGSQVWATHLVPCFDPTNGSWRTSIQYVKRKDRFASQASRERVESTINEYSSVIA